MRGKCFLLDFYIVAFYNECMKIKMLFLLILIFSFAAFGQSAERISNIIGESELTYAEAAYLAGVYSETVAEDASYADAASLMGLSDKADEKITLKDFSGLCVSASGLKCGLMYRATKSARYAFKELKARRILNAAADPSMTVSGRDALALFNQCVQKAEAGSKK